MTAPTIEEQIACMSDITAFGNDMRLSILASLEKLAALKSQPVPVEPECVKYLAQYEQADEDGIIVKVSRQAIHETLTHIDSLQSALKLAQEERDKVIERHTRILRDADERYSELLTQSNAHLKRAEKAEATNRRMVEKYRDLVVAAEKIGGKVTDASNLQISIADVLEMKEALAKLEES